jgi:hypothetical protein
VAKGTQARPRLADVVDIRTKLRSTAESGVPARVSLAPSDFAFLWDECPRCFYLKVARKEARPRTPFPKVFGTIDRAMKSFYMGRRSKELASDVPAGVITQADRWVKSAGLTVPGSPFVSEIRGSLDALIECDDGTVAVVDFKTAEPNADHIATYSRQLHAYALALEQPALGPSTTVSALGLLCFLPSSFTATETAALLGEVKWFEVERDQVSFLRFLIEVVSVLEEPEPPPASPTCAWCRWRDEIRAAS